jgi:hypothetical protein
MVEEEKTAVEMVKDLTGIEMAEGSEEEFLEAVQEKLDAKKKLKAGDLKELRMLWEKYCGEGKSEENPDEEDIEDDDFM